MIKGEQLSVSVRANIQARINVNDGVRDNNDAVVIGEVTKVSGCGRVLIRGGKYKENKSKPM